MTPSDWLILCSLLWLHMYWLHIPIQMLKIRCSLSLCVTCILDKYPNDPANSLAYTFQQDLCLSVLWNCPVLWCPMHDWDPVKTRYIVEPHVRSHTCVHPPYCNRQSLRTTIHGIYNCRLSLSGQNHTCRELHQLRVLHQ